MAITLPDIGSPGWGPVLNGALTGLDNRTAAAETNATAALAAASATVDYVNDVSGIDTPDSLVATLVSNPASATSRELSASTALALASRMGGRSCLFTGDSIIIQGDDFTGSDPIIGDSIGGYAERASGGRMYYVRNTGIGGNTSAQLLARYDTDVTAYGAATNVVGIGTNDARTGVPLSTYAANVQSIVAKDRASGARTVLMTVVPIGSTAAQLGSVTIEQARGLVARYNAWLHDYCATEGIALVDRYSLLVDPTGNIKTEYEFGVEQVHLGANGSKAVGILTWSVLDKLLPGTPAELARDSADPTDLLGGTGLFLADSGGLGSGWAAAGATTSIVTDSAVAGRMQRVTSPGGLGYQTGIYTSKSATPGHVLDLSGLVTNVASGGHQATVQVSFKSATDAGTGTWRVLTSSLDLTRGAFHRRMIVPASTVYLQLYVFAGPSAGYVDVGQLRLRDLTALGLV